jgi:uncharacterized protein (DUF1330 family)
MDAKMNAQQEKSYKFFVDNIASLYEEYGNKFLLIHKSAVIEAFPSMAEAVKSGYEKFGPGEFIVQQGAPNIESNMAKFVGLLVGVA